MRPWRVSPCCSAARGISCARSQPTAPTNMQLDLQLLLHQERYAGHSHSNQTPTPVAAPSQAESSGSLSAVEVCRRRLRAGLCVPFLGGSVFSCRACLSFAMILHLLALVLRDHRRSLPTILRMLAAWPVIRTFSS